MAAILDNIRLDVDKVQNESNGKILKEGESVGDIFFGTTTAKFITRKKRKRSQSFRCISEKSQCGSRRMLADRE